MLYVMMRPHFSVKDDVLGRTLFFLHPNQKRLRYLAFQPLFCDMCPWLRSGFRPNFLSFALTVSVRVRRCSRGMAARGRQIGRNLHEIARIFVTATPTTTRCYHRHQMSELVMFWGTEVKECAITRCHPPHAHLFLATNDL